jgi:hypothetical protein
MRGLITTRHLLVNAGTIIHEFGLIAYMRCLRALVTGQRTTFLDCVCQLRKPPT